MLGRQTSVRSQPMDDEAAEFVWDPERRRLFDANPAGMEFWGESDIVDLRTRTFSAQDPNVITLADIVRDLQERPLSWSSVIIDLVPRNHRRKIKAEVIRKQLEDGRYGLQIRLAGADEVFANNNTPGAIALGALENLPSAVLLLNYQGALLAANLAAREQIIPNAPSITTPSWHAEENVADEPNRSVWKWISQNNELDANEMLNKCIRDGQSTCVCLLPSQTGDRSYRLYFSLTSSSVISVMLEDLTEHKLLVRERELGNVRAIDVNKPALTAAPEQARDSSHNTAYPSQFSRSTVREDNPQHQPEEISLAIQQLASALEHKSDTDALPHNQTPQHQASDQQLYQHPDQHSVRESTNKDQETQIESTTNNLGAIDTIDVSHQRIAEPQAAAAVLSDDQSYNTTAVLPELLPTDSQPDGSDSSWQAVQNLSNNTNLSERQSPLPEQIFDYWIAALATAGEAAMEVDRLQQIVWADARWKARIGEGDDGLTGTDCIQLFSQQSRSKVLEAIETAWIDEADEKSTQQSAGVTTKRVSVDTLITRDSVHVPIELVAIRVTVRFEARQNVEASASQDADALTIGSLTTDLTAESTEPAPSEEAAEEALKYESISRVFIISRDLSRFADDSSARAEQNQLPESSDFDSDDFFTRVSHDLRTPLSAIMGVSDVMQRELLGPIGDERYRAYAADIYGASEHALSLLNDLFDLSILERGERTLEFTQVSILEIVNQAKRMLQLRAESRSLSISVVTAAELPQVIIDRRSLLQIVLNLIDNAVKYANESTQIAISANSASGGEIILRIRNSGIGMSAADIAKAMLPYSRLATQEMGLQAGAGLGLTLVSTLAKANGLKFWLESAPNQGVLALVKFPLNRIVHKQTDF